jgi:cell division protein FtsQ
MKKYSWINVGDNFKLLLVFGLLLFLYSFTTLRNNNRKVAKIEVLFEGNDQQFISQEMVNKLLIEKKQVTSNIRKDAIDLNSLEKVLNNSNMIEKSEVFISVNGGLKAIIKQKTPIARFLTKNASFYIDYQGNKMPLSPIRSARVPVISGEINKKNKKQFVALLRYIFDDDFLKQNIVGMQIYPNQAIKMTNRNYNYEIDFGRPIHIERKFKNYEAFLQKAIIDSTINKYKKIDLKFTQQVVCTK